MENSKKSTISAQKYERAIRKADYYRLGCMKLIISLIAVVVVATTVIFVQRQCTVNKVQAMETNREAEIHEIICSAQDEASKIIKAANDESSKIISDANAEATEIIAEAQAEAQIMIEEANGQVNITTSTIGDITIDELVDLIKITAAEATNQGNECRKGVVHTVLNRTLSDRFPNSISEVIRQKGQFSPVSSGSFETVQITEKVIRSVLEALSEPDNTGGALFFYNPDLSGARGKAYFENKLTPCVTYDDMVFKK